VYRPRTKLRGRFLTHKVDGLKFRSTGRKNLTPGEKKCAERQKVEICRAADFRPADFFTRRSGFILPRIEFRKLGRAARAEKSAGSA